MAIVGTPTQPLTVHISGVTVDGYDPQGRPVAVEAGIVFVDAKGSVKRSHVTNVVTSEGDNAYQYAGGWRGEQPGIGIAQTSRALLAPVDGSRRLEIDRTRVDKYNRVGVLIDGAQNDFAPFAASGAVNWGVITSSQIIGRTLCVNYAGTGSCNTPGLVTTGPLFGQDGLRVTSGAYATVDSSLISQNLVNGTGAPVRGVQGPDATNNANLSRGAGVRYAGARLTSYSTATGLVVDSRIQRSNIVDNAYGAINVQADGATANVGFPIPVTTSNGSPGYGQLLIAENNWWGVRNFGTLPVTPAAADLADREPAGAGEPGQRRADAGRGQRADDVQRRRLLPVPQRPAVGPRHGRLARDDGSAAGRRRRADRGPVGPGDRGPRHGDHAAPPPPVTTSASSACASPTAARRSEPSPRRPTRSRPRSRPTPRAAARAPTPRS